MRALGPLRLTVIPGSLLRAGLPQIPSTVAMPGHRPSRTQEEPPGPGGQRRLEKVLEPPFGLLALVTGALGVSWAERSRSSRCTDGLHRTVWYELQARDWPFKNQAAEALIWQIGSGEGMKRVLASVSLGKEVTVSSHLSEEKEEGLVGGRGPLAWLHFVHTPEQWDLG